MNLLSRSFIRRTTLTIIAAPFVAVVLWLAAAFALGLVRGPGDLGAAEGIPVGIVSNGYHVSLVLPVVAAGVDWRNRFDPADTMNGAAADWLLLGWGDRDFYMQTRRLIDVRPGVLFGALLGLGETTVQVAWLPGGIQGVRFVRLSPERYRALVRVVDNRLMLDASGRAQAYAGTGYGPFDLFYRAHGRYSPVYTCNEWVADALRAAGIAVPVWAPLPQTLLWSLPPA